jgi:hypothetical protein
VNAPAHLADIPFTVCAAPMQRVCGWCGLELARGTSPATTGICGLCRAIRGGRAERGGVMAAIPARVLRPPKGGA